MASQFQKALQAMSDNWADSQAQYDQRFGGVVLPEASYIGKLSEFRLDFVKFKGVNTLVAKRKIVVLDGTYKGHIAEDLMNLNSEWGIIYLRRFIDISGYEAPEPEKVEEVEATIKAIHNDKGVYKFDVKHWKQGDGINVIVNALIDVSDEGEIKDPSPIGSSDEEDEQTLPENTSVKDVKSKKEETKSKSKAKAKSKAKEEKSADEVEDEFTSMNRKELKKYIKDNEIDFRVTAKMKDDDVRDKIRELVSPVESEVEEETEENVPSDAELAKRLMVFAASNGITGLKKSMSLDEMIDIVDEATVAESEIDDEDRILLTMLQLDGIIQE